MKLVFLDTEFTSLHAYTTLISVGLVSADGRECLVTLNDYDRSQITPWIEENVLPHIDETQSVDKLKACRLVGEFLKEISQGEKICLISAGKMNDHILLFQMWHALHPQLKYFHFSLLPDYLYHNCHFDLHTLTFAAGYDPSVLEDRSAFVGHAVKGTAHDALFDAKVVRLFLLRLIKEGRLPAFSAYLPDFGEA